MYSRVKGMAKKCKLLTIFTKTIMHLVPSPPPPPKEIFFSFWDDCNTWEKLEIGNNGYVKVGFFWGGGGWESKQDALCIMVLVKNGE